MTDKELLELAAKAAGIDGKYETRFIHNDMNHGNITAIFLDDDDYFYWNPLTDDGDALRLAVTLHLSMDLFDDFIDVSSTPNDNSIFDIKVPTLQDPYAATRRAITRAAAEIGRVSQ